MRVVASALDEFTMANAVQNALQVSQVERFGAAQQGALCSQVPLSARVVCASQRLYAPAAEKPGGPSSSQDSASTVSPS